MIIQEPEWWEEWTYFNEDKLQTEIKPTAPDKVKQEWEELWDGFFDNKEADTGT